MVEQLYLIEIFVDNLTIFVEDGDKDQNTDKGLIVRAFYGPNTQFIYKESQIAIVPRKDSITKDDKVIYDVEGEQKKGARTLWKRFFKVGKSLLYPSFPDQVFLTIDRYPLEFQVWTDVEGEEPELIGLGSKPWHTSFFTHIKENTHPCLPHLALSSKETIPIMAECCCVQKGILEYVLRLTPLGGVIKTVFQQRIDTDPESFIFKTSHAPSMYECKRVENDDKKYNMVGSIYEIACKEDPDVISRMKRKVEICTELETCGTNDPGTQFACQHVLGAPQKDFRTPKQYPIQKIRMGDIFGPCGNKSCPLAHRMKIFIRNQYAYKKETLNETFKNKPEDGRTSRVCGQCACSADGTHYEKAEKVYKDGKKTTCPGCGGVSQHGETCDDRFKRLYGTGVTPISSKADVLRPNLT